MFAGIGGMDLQCSKQHRRTAVSELRKRIEEALNSTSAENKSNTPDFILADYLLGCLAAFDVAVNWREEWYGRPKQSPASTPALPPPPEVK